MQYSAWGVQIEMGFETYIHLWGMCSGCRNHCKWVQVPTHFFKTIDTGRIRFYYLQFSVYVFRSAMSQSHSTWGMFNNLNSIPCQLLHQIHSTWLIQRELYSTLFNFDKVSIGLPL